MKTDLSEGKDIGEKIKNKFNSHPKPRFSLGKFSEKSQEFRYGNYDRYYGYRNKQGMDLRLPYMKKEWFERKDVLDIGCNAGHFTLRIAKDFSPRVIIGVDIDKSLVKTSKKNVRNYINFDESCAFDFPMSFVVNYGPFAFAVGTDEEDPVKVQFPYNVSFVHENYVLESDDLLQYQNPYFDTILCLSLTKWVHLNWGDDGLKRMFRRMYANLKPGGHMILEAQPWDTYGRKKKITETIYKNYQSIKLFPEQFNQYLLEEVGFTSCELIDIPFHTAKGFCRPLYLFTKSQILDFKNASEIPKHIIFNDEESDERDVELEEDELSD